MTPQLIGALVKHMTKQLRLLLSSGLRAFVQALQSDRRLLQDCWTLRQSGLFCHAHYLQEAPHAQQFPGGAMLHFLLHGGREGKNPHPLFLSAWYLRIYPDVAATGTNPLLHYIRAGSREARNPNPYFDTGWYADRYGIDRWTDGYPLRHYIQHGAARRADPSPHFAARWYAETYLVGTAEQDALTHFLLRGAAAGHRPNPFEAPRSAHPPVTDASICWLKRPDLIAGGKVVLFVTRTLGGELNPRVQQLVDALGHHGIRIVLIVATDTTPGGSLSAITAHVDAVAQRQDRGFAFAAWAHVLRLEPGLLDSDALYLLHDGLIERYGTQAYPHVLECLDVEEADVAGMAAHHEGGWHLASDFLVLRPGALRSMALLRFIHDVHSLPTKEDEMRHYEVLFTAALRNAGLRCRVLQTANDPGNQVNRQTPADQSADACIGPSLCKTASAPLPPHPKEPHGMRHESARTDSHELPPRMLFTGPWNYNNGLGVASRSYVSALRHTRMRLHLSPVRRSFHVHARTAPAVDIRDFPGRADIAVVHLNPDGWRSFLTDEQLLEIQQTRIRVGIWVWETDRIPENWQSGFESVDAIWTPSRYCQDVLAAHSDLPVAVVPHVVPIPASIPPTSALQHLRRQLGIGTEERTILFAFDGASYLVRKNPFALVRAFARSGLAAQGWRLILKTKNLFDSVEAGRHLLNLCQRTSGVLLLNMALGPQAMQGLMSMADIYASPHCSEGFGLTVAEAMALGKLVVATDYGGTRDFVDASCGFPVRYTMTALEATHGHYVQGNMWASIDEAHLSASLQEAADCVMRGDTTIAQRARERIAHDLCAANVGALIEEQVSQLLLDSPARQQ